MSRFVAIDNGDCWSYTVRHSIQMPKGNSMTNSDIQYISDGSGKPVGVLVPIEVWREIESERETAHLLRTDTMKKRLLEAKSRFNGISLADARAKLGI